MINDIAYGISIALKKVFGEGYKIHNEHVRQGTKRPCFFILNLLANQKQFGPNRFYREHAFDVHYFPASGENEEMHNVANELYEALEYITFVNGDLLHGTNMRHEIVDGVLHFFVNYNTFMRREVEKVPMEELTVNQGLRS